MNFVGEQEQFHPNPPEQHNLPVGCDFNGVLTTMSKVMECLQQRVERIENQVVKIGYQVEQIVKFIHHPLSYSSSSPQQAEPSVSPSYRLCFEKKMPDTIFTKDKIEDQGASLLLYLCDDTGKRLEITPEMQNLKVSIQPLDGFKFDNNDNFTVEDFDKHIATPRQGKPSLLDGKCEILLINGFAEVHGIYFTDNSSVRLDKKFKLGAKIIGLPFGLIVRPAVTEAFKVKEFRGKDDRKYPNPLPSDNISRLVNITKKGIIYDRAVKHEVPISTVLDFLQLYHVDATKLQDILKLTGKKWKETVKNAEACDLTKELYKYIYHDDASGVALLLNCAFKIESVEFKDQAIQPYESLDQFQKEKVCELRQTAYEKRKELTKVYDSSNQTPIQAGLTYPCHVEQPATALYSMDSNVCRTWESADVPGIASCNISNTSLINTVTDQVSGSFGQLSSGFFITDAYGAQDTAMGLGNSRNVVTGNMAYQFPNNGFALPNPDLVAAHQDHLQQVGMINSQKVHTPMYQNSIQNKFTLPSGIIQHKHHQEQQQQQLALAALIADSHEFNQMCSTNSPSNPLHVDRLDPMASDQDCLTGINFESSSPETGELLKGYKRLDSMNSFQHLYGGSPLTTPPQEERSNVSARDSATRKLITTCYVKKAAVLFMISFQQNPASSSPTKKRKLQ